MSRFRFFCPDCHPAIPKASVSTMATSIVDLADCVKVAPPIPPQSDRSGTLESFAHVIRAMSTRGATDAEVLDTIRGGTERLPSH